MADSVIFIYEILWYLECYLTQISQPVAFTVTSETVHYMSTNPVFAKFVILLVV